jgi:hypothetical protein
MQSVIDDQLLEITHVENPQRENGHLLNEAQESGHISLATAKAATDDGTPRELAQLNLFADAPNRNLHPSLSGASPAVSVEDDGTG